MPSILQADVYVSSRLPLAIKRRGETSTFSPISCTLMHGESEAVLVDTPISISQTEDLASWIKTTAPGKDLRYVYITHGHGDHWFGITVLRKHWPNLRALATPGTVEHMKEQIKPAIFERTWLSLFPGGQIPQSPELAEAMKSPVFEIEGHEFRAVEVGHTDTYNTTVLHVPSIHLIDCLASKMRLSTFFTVAATAQSAMGCTFVFWLAQEASWGGTNGVSHLARIWESNDPDFKGTADASVNIGFQGGCNNVGYKGQTYEFCFERAANHDLHGPATVRRTNNGGGTKRNIHPDGQEYRDVWSVGLGSVDIHAYYVTGIECPSS